MYVVMGASGNVGGAALQTLQGGGHPVRALCRRPPQAEAGQGVDWLAVDALDAASLTQAFRGARCAFVMNPVGPDADNVFEQAARLSDFVATALREAGVPHAVVLSSQGAHLSEGTGVITALHRFETALQQAGCPLTILRAAYFMESWQPMAMIARDSGAMPALLSPTDRPILTVSSGDVGRLAAGIMVNPQPGVINVVGPRRYSEVDAASVLTDLLGREVALAEIPGPEVAAFHRAAGLGASFSDAIAQMYAAINSGDVPFEDTPETRWSEQPTRLDSVLASLPS